MILLCEDVMVEDRAGRKKKVLGNDSILRECILFWVRVGFARCAFYWDLQEQRKSFRNTHLSVKFISLMYVTNCRVDFSVRPLVTAQR